MIKKRIMLSILIFGFIHNTQIHAFNVTSIQKTLCSWWERNQNATFPFVILGVIGITAFIFYQSAQKLEEKVEKLDVLKQKLDATCGYHSLHNALIS